ncbi:hypothetical protein CBOM_07374 [Ceraceosorus bombacis]|uniref:Uncharacterized protein n=1 Tax=Ceraceosorus bombacis TaxID=401625 RepID=A0A0P1BAA5_9BASI|nr:hypothetical protein CBOM_07374 [Ceraceosorus bombacis]
MDVDVQQPRRMGWPMDYVFLDREQIRQEKIAGYRSRGEKEEGIGFYDAEEDIWWPTWVHPYKPWARGPDMRKPCHGCVDFPVWWLAAASPALQTLSLTDECFRLNVARDPAWLRNCDVDSDSAVFGAALQANDPPIDVFPRDSALLPKGWAWLEADEEITSKGEEYLTCVLQSRVKTLLTAVFVGHIESFSTGSPQIFALRRLFPIWMALELVVGLPYGQRHPKPMMSECADYLNRLRTSLLPCVAEIPAIARPQDDTSISEEDLDATMTRVVEYCCDPASEPKLDAQGLYTCLQVDDDTSGEPKGDATRAAPTGAPVRPRTRLAQRRCCSSLRKVKPGTIAEA